MSISLIESEHRSQKSLGGSLVSIAVHASLITIAVYATATAGEAVVKPPIHYVDILYPTPPKGPETRTKPIVRIRPPEMPKVPTFPPVTIRPPINIPTTIPPVTPSTPVIDDGGMFGSSPDGDGTAPTNGVAGDAGDALFAAQVEKPATPRNGNPSPKYPSLLESSRVEGGVLVQFVVDTLGIADMSTFRVLDATNELFAESTRASLAKWRFYPAEAGGRKVRQIVQLPLRFVAPRR
jgi:protein TonB